MSKSITVAGIALTISAPYSAGHAINDAEAKALNTIRAENIGNNVRKAINDLKAGLPEGVELTAEQLAAIQKQVSDYDANYVFEMRTSTGPRVIDPIGKEAVSIARALLSKALADAKITRKDYGDEKYAAKLAEIASAPAVLDAAKKAVASRGKLTEGAALTL
jgi:hypothetical protein